MTGYEGTGQLAPVSRGERPRPRGQGDWAAAYERPMGVRRDDTPAPRYERTGEIDRSGAYEAPRHDQSGPLSAPPAYDPDDRPGYGEPGTGGYRERGPRYEWTGEADRSGAYHEAGRSGAYHEAGRSGAYQQPAGYGPGDGLRAQPAQYSPARPVRAAGR